MNHVIDERRIRRIQYRAPRFDDFVGLLLEALRTINNRPCLGHATGTAYFQGFETKREEPGTVFLWIAVLDRPWNEEYPLFYKTGETVYPSTNFDAMTPGGTTSWIKINPDPKDKGSTWRDRPPMI